MNKTDAGDVQRYIEMAAKVVVDGVHEYVENWSCCRARFWCCREEWLALPAETNSE